MSLTHDTALAFARNLQALMDHHGLSQAQLAQKTGIGQSTLSKLLKVERPLEINPRASTMSRLADFFGIQAWQLLAPDMPLDLMLDGRLGKLIENYGNAPEEGRTLIERIAEGEVRYAASERPSEKKAGTGR